MKKLISGMLSIAILIMSLPILAVTATLPEGYEVTDFKIFINDELQQAIVYRNNNFFQSDKKEYVPLQACMEALGCTFEQKSPTNIIIKTPDNRIIDMRVGEKTISYTGGVRGVARVPWEYFEVDGAIYYPLYEFPELIDCEVLYEGNNIYLDTAEYLKKSNANSNIGRKVNIDVYVNDIKIETLVYKNRKSPPIPGPDNLSDYVQLKPILEVLGIDLSATAEWNYLEGEQVEMDGETYVPFSTIRYNIDGSLKQDDYNSMYLYSADYVREDIPATLEEAYKALDELLDPEDIEYIKNLAQESIIELHFGLGMWIRNNWLYPTNSRLTKALLELNPNFSHPDEMSHFILVGYHRYLNSGSTSTPLTENKITVTLNGAELTFDVPPQIINGRTLVPVRKIFEALGADVHWIDLENGHQIILAVKNKIKIFVIIDEEKFYKFVGNDISAFLDALDDMQPIAFDVPPMIIDGRTHVPVRTISEALGVDVAWDETKKTVILNCDKEFIENFNTDKTFCDDFMALIEEDNYDGPHQHSIRKYDCDYIEKYADTLNVMFDNEWTLISTKERFEENDGYICSCGYDGRSQQFIEWEIEYRDGNGELRTFVMDNRSTLSSQIQEHISQYIATYYKENFYDVYLKDIPLAGSSYVFCFFVRMSSYTSYEEVRDIDEATTRYQSLLDTPEGTICLAKLTPANVFEMCPVYLSVNVGLSGDSSYGQSFEENVIKQTENMVEAMNGFANNRLNAQVYVGYHQIVNMYTGSRGRGWAFLQGEKINRLDDRAIFESYKGMFW